jgi:uncharacterized protein YcnI
MSMMALSCLFMLLASVKAHISMNPNYGAATGGYFLTSMKIPHGHHGMYTSRLVVNVPRGIASVKPEVPAGWNVSVESYDLAEEDRYESHGNLVNTGPDKIIFQATHPSYAVHNDHLMMIDLQMKLGCSFRDQVGTNYSGSNSVWQGQHTLWFKVEQSSSHYGSLAISDMSPWAGALADHADGSSPTFYPPSSTGLKACPYLFFYAGTRCSVEHSGEQVTGGMTWMNSYVAPVANQASVMHEQHVIELATEAALTSQESLASVYANQDELATVESTLSSLKDRVKALEDDQNMTLSVALVGLVLSAVLSGFAVGLCIFRISAAAQFARVISAVPLMSERATSSAGVSKDAV